VSGASDKLCIAVIVPFLRIRSVAISDSRTMAASSRPTVKPGRPFACTNIYGAITKHTRYQKVDRAMYHLAAEMLKPANRRLSNILFWALLPERAPVVRYSRYHARAVSGLGIPACVSQPWL